MMENIAPAVFNGGFSTLLALSFLITCKSHVAMSFFKIFFMICLFGLFHGLVLLPTVLCMIGPSDEDSKNNLEPAAAVSDINNDSSRTTTMNNNGGGLTTNASIEVNGNPEAIALQNIQHQV